MQRVARLLRVAGVSGIGKTAIARAIAEEAAKDGWLTIFAAAHRIQAGLPLVFARCVLSEAIRALGDEAAAYSTGLPSEQPELALLPLIDAILIDRPVLIVADDAQWADPESTDLLVKVTEALADRPLAIVSTERTDEGAGPAFPLHDAAMLVGELDRHSSEKLVQSLLPGAPSEVQAMIAEHGRGRAIDMVALARYTSDPSTMTTDDVRATLRTLIAHDLSLATAAEREFLQLCSLIGEPIHYALLRELYADEDRLLPLVARCSGNYLVKRDGLLYFTHSAIAQSIRETIAIDVPYRKRIFSALRNLPIHTLEHGERLVEQASAIGDLELEAKQLGELIASATRLKVPEVAVRATERILAIAPLDKHEALSLYSRLSVQYNALSRDGDTHRICTEALGYARNQGIRHDLGQLVLSDLFALFFRGEYDAYDRTIERFAEYLETPNDCGYLEIGRLFRAICTFDASAHDSALKTFRSLDVTDPTLKVRVDVFSAFHRARLGEIDNALAMYEQARLDAQLLNPLLGVMVDSGELMMAFQAFGPRHPHSQAAFQRVAEDIPTHATFKALDELLQGSLLDATATATEALVRVNGVYVRRHLLGIAATAATLSGKRVAPALDTAIRQETLTVREDYIAGSQLQLAAYVCAASGEKHETLMNACIDFASRQPPEPMVVFSPIVIVFAAKAQGRRDILERIERGDLACDKLALNLAQHELARLAAASSLGKAVDRAFATALADKFVALGAPYFASLAQGLIPSVTPIATTMPGNLTRRELEITGLVAEGRTNREIAAHLVLSERTVEAHIANAFAKTGAPSRSRLAVWYERTNSRRPA